LLCREAVQANEDVFNRGRVPSRAAAAPSWYLPFIELTRDGVQRFVTFILQIIDYGSHARGKFVGTFRPGENIH
jgi:hypothetical protein